jgi:bifunctional DNA-binding transcriptional regulator/antitoxin component of YhaV-PrlF toxin-antitoxin module
LTDELVLGKTVFSGGGRTTVPSKVMEMLKLRYTPQRRQKLLWIQEGADIVIKKVTLQSSFRKTILSRGGKTAIPKHIREVLKLKPTADEEECLIWIQKGVEIIVRKGSEPPPGSFR